MSGDRAKHLFLSQAALGFVRRAENNTCSKILQGEYFSFDVHLFNVGIIGPFLNVL